MSGPRPTLRSLAARAGVSPMTVSLALRNSREVSAATRRRLQRLAAAQGYRPDPTVTQLMHHLRTRRPARFQANIAGLVQMWAEHRRQVGDYVERLRDGLTTRAAELGYAFDTIYLGDFRTGAQLQRVLLNRGIEGIVVLPLLRSMDLSRLLDWSMFSVVSTTPSLVAPAMHSVMPNHFDNTIAVCQMLQKLGFRRIGLAISRDWNRRVKFRWSGGVAWQNQFGGTESVPPLITNQPGPELEAAAFADWLRREKPDAVITDAAIRATIADVLSSLPARSRPRMITMNWPDTACDAGINQRPERVGSAAIDLLAGLISRGEKGLPAQPHTTVIDGEWVPAKLADKKSRRRDGRATPVRAPAT